MKTTQPTFELVDEQFVLAEHWLSDWSFFKFEIHFFEKLLERNILFLEDDRDLPVLQNYQAVLRQLLVNHTTVYLQIVNRIEELEQQRRENKDIGELENLTAQELLHRRIVAFIKKYKSYKHQLFSFIARSMAAGEAELAMT